MKKKKNRKSVLITLIVLIVICLSCGTLGLLESKKVIDKPKEDKNYKVSYRYYIDGIEVEEEVKQEFSESPNPEFEGAVNEIPNYKFEKYTCTNNITGEWDDEKWEFTPDLKANTTCRLYFLKTFHSVTVKANNGKLPSNGPEEKITVELEKEGTLNILPNDGYKFEKVECNNEIQANYDETTKDLKISNVKKDGICTIYYKISDYTAEISASNGTVTEPKKSANYGGTLTFDVTPSENYRFEKIECTNGQKATYDNGKVVVSSISNDTICSIEFKPIKYSVTLEVINGTLLSTSSSPQSVSEGKNTSFGISPNDGYTLSGAKTSCTNPNGAKIEVSGQGMVSVYNVTSDLHCKVELVKKAN